MIYKIKGEEETHALEIHKPPKMAVDVDGESRDGRRGCDNLTGLF